MQLSVGTQGVGSPADRAGKTATGQAGFAKLLPQRSQIPDDNLIVRLKFLILEPTARGRQLHGDAIEA